MMSEYEAGGNSLGSNAVPHFIGLDANTLDSLATGREDPNTINFMQTCEKSFQKVQLFGIVDFYDNAEGQVAADLGRAMVDEAFDILCSAEEKGLDVHALLNHPPFSGWWTRMLTRIRGEGCEDVPLPAEAGYFTSLAAVAAAQAGLETTLSIPLLDRRVTLPGIGQAYFPGESVDAIAQASTHSGKLWLTQGEKTIEVPLQGGTPDTDTWQSYRRYTFEAEGLEWRVGLNDIDPYRLNPKEGALHQRASERLGTLAEQRWKSQLNEAWALLARDHRTVATEIASNFYEVVPDLAVGPFQGFSSSSKYHTGSALISEMNNPVHLAETLVHEYSHNKLNLVLRAITLTDPAAHNKYSDLYYAPWRNDPRPGTGLLHGVYSFFAITEFWRRHCAANPDGTASLGSDVAHFELALWRKQTSNAAQSLTTYPGLTESGGQFVEKMVGAMDGWMDIDIPPDPQTFADDTAAYHYGLWRAHHLQPDALAVEQAVSAWLAQKNIPREVLTAATTVQTDPVTSRFTVWAILSRMKLAGHEAFKAMVADPGEVANHIRGATYADVICVAGHQALASELYLKEMGRSTASPRALVGLGLAIKNTLEPVSRALLTRPELVRTIQARLIERTGNPISALAIAEWISTPNG